MDFQCQHQAGITTDWLITTMRRVTALCHQIPSHRPLLILDFLKWALVEEITLFTEPRDLRAGKKLRRDLITTYVLTVSQSLSRAGPLSFRTICLMSIGHVHSKWTYSPFLLYSLLPRTQRVTPAMDLSVNPSLSPTPHASPIIPSYLSWYSSYSYLVYLWSCLPPSNPFSTKLQTCQGHSLALNIPPLHG